MITSPSFSSIFFLNHFLYYIASNSLVKHSFTHCPHVPGAVPGAEGTPRTWQTCSSPSWSLESSIKERHWTRDCRLKTECQGNAEKTSCVLEVSWKSRPLVKQRKGYVKRQAREIASTRLGGGRKRRPTWLEFGKVWESLGRSTRWGRQEWHRALFSYLLLRPFGTVMAPNKVKTGSSQPDIFLRPLLHELFYLRPLGRQSKESEYKGTSSEIFHIRMHASP